MSVGIHPLKERPLLIMPGETFTERMVWDAWANQPTNADIQHYPKKSSNLIQHHPTSSDVIRHHLTSPIKNPTSSDIRHISNRIGHHRISSVIIRYHPTSSNIIRHRPISYDIIQHHLTSSDIRQKSDIIQHHQSKI